MNENIITQGQFHGLVELGSFVDAQWDNFMSSADVAKELSLEDEH